MKLYNIGSATFNQGVRVSTPRWVTTDKCRKTVGFAVFSFPRLKAKCLNSNIFSNKKQSFYSSIPLRLLPRLRLWSTVT